MVGINLDVEGGGGEVGESEERERRRIYLDGDGGVVVEAHLEAWQSAAWAGDEAWWSAERRRGAEERETWR